MKRPRSFTRVIFRPAFDSRSSFFAPETATYDFRCSQLGMDH